MPTRGSAYDVGVPTSAAPSDASPSGLDTDLGWMLGVVFRAYLKSADAATEGLPGGPRGRQVLAAAAREEPRSQSALAHRLGIDRTVMTYLLDDLVDAGLVERRPDPADRRNRRVTATEHGRATLAELDHRLRLVEEHVLGGLGDGERETVRHLLQKVAAHLNDADPVADTCEVVHDIGVTAAQHHAP